MVCRKVVLLVEEEGFIFGTILIYRDGIFIYAKAHIFLGDFFFNMIKLGLHVRYVR